MKTVKLILILSVSLGLFTACNDDENNPTPTGETIPNQENLAQFLAADQAFSQSFISMSQLMLNPEAENLTGRATNCAEFIFAYRKEGDLHITELGFDFGAGCETDEGDFISGSIVATLEGEARQFGAISLSMDNFTFNDTLLNGTLRGALEVDDRGNAYLSGSLTEGIARFSNEDFISLNFEKQFAWVAGRATPEETVDDIFEITGNGDYLSTVAGAEYAYSFDIANPIQFKSECAGLGFPFFSAGNLEIDYSDVGATDTDNFFSINYGSGNCDANVLLNVDGEDIQTELWYFWFL